MLEINGSNSSEIAFSFVKVTKGFKNGNVYVNVLDSLSFDVFENETVAIVGPSGCGKSTLLKLAAGLDDCDSGAITVLRRSVAVAQKSGAIGFAFQNPSLLPWRTVKENVHLPFDINPRHGHEELVSKSLALVELSDYADFLPAKLSAGMAERTGLARALVSNPKILLLDEPFRSLDEITRRDLNKKLREIICSSVTQSTTIFVTHSIAEALYLADRVILLSNRPAKIVKVWRIPHISLDNVEDVYINKEISDIRQDVLATMQQDRGSI